MRTDPMIGFYVFVAIVIALSLIASPLSRAVHRWKRRRYIKRRLSWMALDRLRFERTEPELAGDRLIDRLRERVGKMPAGIRQQWAIKPQGLLKRS